MFPQRLRALRKERKLTAKALGDKFSLAESTISGYENGVRNPDLDQLEKFADYFGVTVDYLLGRTNDREGTNAKTGGRAYYDGGADWTDEERKLANAAVEDWRRRKKELEEKLRQSTE